MKTKYIVDNTFNKYIIPNWVSNQGMT